jgi:beta-lactamase class A
MLEFVPMRHQRSILAPQVHGLVLTLGLLFAVLWAVLGAAPAAADSLDGAPSLRESYDPGLQARLERTLDSLGLRPAVDQGKLAVALVDITDLGDPRLASVNGDAMLYAASLPKIAILLAAFVEIERGRLDLDAATRRRLTEMIRVSSNGAATEMLNRVGKERLIEILRSERFRLYDPATNGGLWVGKEYAKGTAYRRDPLHNLSHGATAFQAARFYYLLATGRLVGPALGREMKAMLARPGIRHKFVKGLAGLPGVRIYRKSGSWGRWHADSALVEAGGHRYILVALAEHPAGGRWLARMAAPLHRLVVPAEFARAAE